MDRITTLVDWATSHGARLHPDVEVYDDAETGLSLRVKPDRTAPLPAWDTVVSLPTSLSLSYLDALRLAGAQTDSSEERPAFALSSDIVSRAKPHVVGRLLLAKQYLAGPASPWHAYVQSLPQPDDVDNATGESSWALPPFWPADDAEVLEGTNVEVGLDKIRADVAAEWAHAADLLRAHGDDVDARVTVGLYRWAYCIFSSRSFRPSLVVPEDQAAALLPEGVSMDDFSVLLPLFDIGNHDMTAEVRWELSGVAEAADTAAAAAATASGDGAADAGATCNLRVGREFQPGTQVFNNYSVKTNAELLLGYGFMLPATPDLHNDYIHVRKRADQPKASDEYYISLRPMSHHSSLLGQHRSELPPLPSTEAGQGQVIGPFLHVQPDMVWDIYCTLRATVTAEPPADEARLRSDLFAGRFAEGSQEHEHLEQTVAVIQHKVMQELERLSETDFEVDGDGSDLTRNQKLALEYRARCRAVLESTLEDM